uniref:J domain-containing protein n=1 Tax=Globodera rostochiensis TaxID=31243 RepID=A0A914HKE6_GLORO
MKGLATKAFQLVDELFNLHVKKRNNLDRTRSYQSSFERNVSGLNKTDSARSNQYTHGLYRNDSTRSSTSTYGLYRNDSTPSSTSMHGSSRSKTCKKKDEQLTKICKFFNCPDDEAKWGKYLKDARNSTHPDKYKEQEMKDLATKAFQLVDELFNLHVKKRNNLDRTRSYQSSFERNVSGLNKTDSARSNQSTHGLYRNNSTRSSTSSYGLDRSGSTRSSKSSDNVGLNRSRSNAVRSNPPMNNIVNERRASNAMKANEFKKILRLQQTLLSDETNYEENLKLIESFIKKNYLKEKKTSMLNDLNLMNKEIIFARNVFKKQKYKNAFTKIINKAEDLKSNKLEQLIRPLKKKIQKLLETIHKDIKRNKLTEEEIKFITDIKTNKLTEEEIKFITVNKVREIEEMLNHCNQAENARNKKNIELEKETRLESEISQEKITKKIYHFILKSRKASELKKKQQIWHKVTGRIPPTCTTRRYCSRSSNNLP